MNGDCKQLFQLIYAILAVFTILFIMVLGYCLNVRNNQIELTKRTFSLEKKNGHEQHQLNQLKDQVKQLQKKLKNYKTSSKN